MRVKLGSREHLQISKYMNTPAVFEVCNRLAAAQSCHLQPCSRSHYGLEASITALVCLWVIIVVTMSDKPHDPSRWGHSITELAEARTPPRPDSGVSPHMGSVRSSRYSGSQEDGNKTALSLCP